MGGIRTRVPLLAIQKALVKRLRDGQTTPVFDDVANEARLPYISIGAINVKSDGSKDTAIYDVSIQLHLWSNYRGKKEINGMMDDVANVLSYAMLDTTEDNFKIINQEIDFFEAFAEDTLGYHGVITVVIKIQDMEV